MQLKLNRLIGWKDLPDNFFPQDDPQTEYIVVSGHSSCWDIVVWLCYAFSIQFKNVAIIGQEKLKNWEYGWLRRWVYLLIAPDKRNSNTLQTFVSEFKKIPHSVESPRIIGLSPKGAISKCEWRTGYYYMAKEIGCKVIPVIVDYTNRELRIGKAVNPATMSLEECTQQLQHTLGKKGILYNESSEYPIYDNDYCPYEALFPFDSCAVSMSCFIPYMLGLFYVGNYWQFISTILSVSYIWQYHLSREGTGSGFGSGYTNKQSSVSTIIHYRKANAAVSVGFTLNRVIYNIYNYGVLSTIPGVSICSAALMLFFYMNCIPRGFDKRRGKYVIFRSAGNMFWAAFMYSLLYIF